MLCQIDLRIKTEEDVEKSKKKKKKKTKERTEDNGEAEGSVEIEGETNGNGTMLADVQCSKPFVLASSSIPEKMLPHEWPLLLKVG